MDPRPPGDFRTLCVVTSLVCVLLGCNLSYESRSRTAHGSREALGASLEGRAIEAWVFDGRASGGMTSHTRSPAGKSPENGQPTVLVVGGIHGNELSGVWLARLLVDIVRAHPATVRGRRVVVLPEANPDGLHRRTRTNGRGVDINRNFPARNYRQGRASGPYAQSEPETRVLVRALERYDPVLVVALHAPLGCVDPDGGPEVRALALEMSRLGGLPPGDLEALPGSLGSYVSLELGRSAITYELESHRPSTTMRDSHLRALIFAIVGAGRLQPGVPRAIPQPRTAAPGK